MAEFTLNGITLDLPDAHLTPPLIDALQAGRYENAESQALTRHLRAQDRYLDLGAGAGYLMALAARLVVPGGGSVHGVEAGPEMAKVARATLVRNGATGKVIWGALVPDDFPAARVVFQRRQAFWASGLAGPATGDPARQVEVPARRFGHLLRRFRPTVLSIDIEGGERDLFEQPLPPDLRLLILELHPKIYHAAGVKRIFDGLSASGFSYCPAGSRGAVVVFERVT